MNIFKRADFLIIFLVLSCTGSHETSVEKFIYLPESIEYYHQTLDSNSISPSSDKLKIYTLIDVSCSTCLTKFEKLDSFRKDIKTFDKIVEIIPICHSGDYSFEMFKYLNENDRIHKTDLLMILDLNNSFLRQNKDLISPTGTFTALTNQSNKVLLLGDPINNEKDKQLFVKELLNL